MSSEIEHVSDTAFWVAAYRAKETERADALFRDPLAAVLLGERGRAIERQMPGRRLMYFIMVVRTCAIDRLILHALERGVDTVLNLGAGLDTRPYRLALPSTLRWIEADFPDLIQFKTEKLAQERAVCALERVALDLSVRAERQALLARVAEPAVRVLLITEGVIPYLPDDEVGRLADDVFAEAKFGSWVQEYYGFEARRHRGKVRANLKSAPFKFAAPDWFAFFAQHRFVPKTIIPMREEALRNGRRPPLLSLLQPLMWDLGPKFRKKMDLILGYAEFEPRR